MTNTSPVFQAKRLDTSLDVLRALAHPLRFQLMTFIRDRGSVSVQEIYQTLGLEQSHTSQQLSVLRRNDLVLATRDGKHVNYEVVLERYDRVMAAVENFLGEPAMA